MVVVTGGAGFIGSNVVAALSARGCDVVICDWLRQDERWRNLAKHEIAGIVAPEKLLTWLSAKQPNVDAVIHLGAISATTETDVDLIVEKNVRSTLDLLDYCTEAKIRLLYASSAATYGSGGAGFDDVFSSEHLAKLRPLNAYGWSKHLVDRRIIRLVEQQRRLPPQWVGLKFFNVYGPNEYHKGSMQSVVAKSFGQVREGKPLSLFRSYRSDYADGCQLRDFIYIDDCVDAIIWFLDHQAVSGLFNLGTGYARTWLDLANAVCDALGRPREVEFIEMPVGLVDKYQYFTEAKMTRLRTAGYERPFTSLEDGIFRYVRQYLLSDDPFN